MSNYNLISRYKTKNDYLKCTQPPIQDMFEGIFLMRHVLWSSEQIRRCISGMMHLRKIYCIFKLDVSGLNWTYIIYATLCYLFDDRVEARAGRNTKVLYESQIILYLQVFSIYTYVTLFTIFESLSVISFLLMSFGALVLYRIKSFWWLIIFFPEIRFRWNIFFPRLLVKTYIFLFSACWKWIIQDHFQLSNE